MCPPFSLQYQCILTKFESRELVDLLHSMSFADDYREVLRLYDALLPTEEKHYDWEGSLINFVFCNADCNIRTLTGHDTWHALGGIACVTPAGDYVEPALERSPRVRTAVDTGKFGEYLFCGTINQLSPGSKRLRLVSYSLQILNPQVSS